MTSIFVAAYRTRRSTATLAFALFLTSAATAQNLGEGERTALYRDGSAAADAGEWSVAAEKFRKVIEIRSAPKALIALAIAEDHLGHLGSAKRAYERAVIDAHASNLADDETAASQALAAIAPRIPTLAVHIPNPTHVNDVTLDGKTIPTHDADYGVDPGEHTVIGRGDSEFRKVVNVKEGEHAEVSVDITPTLKTVTTGNTGPTHPLEPTSSGGGFSVGAVVVGVVGVVGMGVGSGLWAVGQSQDNDVRAQCGGQTTNCPLSAKPEADSASTNIIAGDIVFAIGAALAVTGAAWLVISLLHHNKPPVAGWISPTGFGMHGSF